MNIFQLAETLPNGFHDAVLSELTISWVDRVARLKLEIWCGDMNAPTGLRESYRPSELTLHGVEYFVIDSPDPTYPYRKQGPVTIDLATVEQSPAHPPGTGVPFRLWVGQWNAFMNVSATEAELRWLGEAHVAHA